MMQLFIAALLTSLQIVFIHVLFFDGMLLAKVRRWFFNVACENDDMPCRWLAKPLFDCLICMTSVWGILLYAIEWHLQFNIVAFLFTVGGMNVLFSFIIEEVEDMNGEKFVNNNDDSDWT